MIPAILSIASAPTVQGYQASPIETPISVSKIPGEAAKSAKILQAFGYGDVPMKKVSATLRDKTPWRYLFTVGATTSEIWMRDGRPEICHFYPADLGQRRTRPIQFHNDALYALSKAMSVVNGKELRINKLTFGTLQASRDRKVEAGKKVAKAVGTILLKDGRTYVYEAEMLVDYDRFITWIGAIKKQ